MAKLNTHGLTIHGLKKASGETVNCGRYSPAYHEIFYNRETGEVWAIYQYSLGMNSWTHYHDNSVIKVCNTQDHMTVQEIADAIADRVQEIAWRERVEGQPFALDVSAS